MVKLLNTQYTIIKQAPVLRELSFHWLNLADLPAAFHSWLPSSLKTLTFKSTGPPLLALLYNERGKLPASVKLNDIMMQMCWDARTCACSGANQLQNSQNFQVFKNLSTTVWPAQDVCSLKTF